jgi:hypothetical protein
MTARLLLISKSVQALLPYWHGPLGQLFTPRLLAGLDITEGCGIRWAADNDCFHGFHPPGYLELLEAISYRSGCLFVTAPDVVADAKATLALFERWQPVLQRVWATVNEADVDPGMPVHQPIALVAQDGLERLPVPWEDLQALFIGGSTQWKLGPHASQPGPRGQAARQVGACRPGQHPAAHPLVHGPGGRLDRRQRVRPLHPGPPADGRTCRSTRRTL